MLFFDRTPPSGRLWVYDLRTGVHVTLKQDPLRRHHLDDFVAAYRPGGPRGGRVPSARFRPFGHAELLERPEADLDLSRPGETAPDLPPPDRLARAIVADLTAALREFQAVADSLQDGPPG